MTLLSLCILLLEKDVRDFAGKLISAGVTTGLLIATCGITGDEYKDARSLIREHRQRRIYIVIMENDDLLEMASGTHPYDKPILTVLLWNCNAHLKIMMFVLSQNKLKQK